MIIYIEFSRLTVAGSEINIGKSYYDKWAICKLIRAEFYTTL